MLKKFATLQLQLKKGTNMTNRQKYIEAAKLIADSENLHLVDGEHFCCNSLEKVKLDNKKFEFYFEPYEHAYVYWGNFKDPKNRLSRTLALLFLAEMENDK